MAPFQVFDYASISVTLFFFALGSIFDLRKREVSDKVWLLYGPIGLTITIARTLVEPSEVFLTIVSIGITAGVSLGLFYFGLFGGADAKAMICLGLSIPLFPTSYDPLLGYLHPFFPIMVVVSGFLLSISVAIWIGFRNLFEFLAKGSKMFEGLGGEPEWKKAVAFLVGYPADVSRLISSFSLYPLEEVVEDSSGARRKFRLFFNAEADRDDMVSKLVGSLPKVGSPSKVWVSPGLPLLLFFFIGLVVTLIVGDLIFSAVLLLLVR